LIQNNSITLVNFLTSFHPIASSPMVFPISWPCLYCPSLAQPLVRVNSRYISNLSHQSHPFSQTCIIHSCGNPVPPPPPPVELLTHMTLGGAPTRDPAPLIYLSFSPAEIFPAPLPNLALFFFSPFFRCTPRPLDSCGSTKAKGSDSLFPYEGYLPPILCWYCPVFFLSTNRIPHPLAPPFLPFCDAPPLRCQPEVSPCKVYPGKFAPHDKHVPLRKPPVILGRCSVWLPLHQPPPHTLAPNPGSLGVFFFVTLCEIFHFRWQAPAPPPKQPQRESHPQSPAIVSPPPSSLFPYQFSEFVFPSPCFGKVFWVI